MRGWELDKIVKRTFLEFSGLIIFHVGIFRYQNLVSATVILGKMAQHARLWALLLAKLLGQSKSVSNMALGQWIELQHIQRSMF